MNSKFRLMLTLAFVAFLSFCTKAQSQKIGKVTNAVLSEISGITESSYNDGYFWVHNDSGDESQIYLIDSMAKLQLTVKLDGINLVDCEDIAKITVDKVSYLLLADIGNNRRNREVLTIYMIPEPRIDFKSAIVHIDSDKVKKIEFKYSDKKRDAESIFVDDQNKDIYIVSKRDFQSTVFSFPLSAVEKSTVLSLQPQLLLPFTFATSADMSKDGRFIVIKNLTNIYLWERPLDEPILETLARTYQQIPYEIEPQGEAICFANKGHYFYTISERPLGLDSYLYKYIY